MTPAAFAKLALAQEGAVQGSHHVPVKGKWGVGGATNIRLKAADVPTMRSALAMAWQNAGTAGRKTAKR